MNCPCGSNLEFAICCERIHKDLKEATTAEMLMRARYSAFAVHNIEFLFQTTHLSTRKYHNKKEIEIWAKENKWMNLEILKSTKDKVEFKAHFLDYNLTPQIHHEKSTFKIFEGNWYYLDGILIT
jgi:SEC-C motif-containing protein